MLATETCVLAEVARAGNHGSTTGVGNLVVYNRKRNTYIVGAQCTGKTTIVNALEASFAQKGGQNANGAIVDQTQTPRLIREVARTVLREKGFSRDDMNTPARALQLQQCILEAQLNAEEAADAANPSPWYICDRSGLDPIAYAQVYAGQEAADQLLASSQWANIERRMRAGVVILCEAGCSWLVDDGTRLMTSVDEWMRLDATFRELLEARHIGYTVIPKDMMCIDERVAAVKEAMESQLP